MAVSLGDGYRKIDRGMRRRGKEQKFCRGDQKDCPCPARRARQGLRKEARENGFNLAFAP